MTAQEQQDEFHDIRDAVAKLCAQFPGEYWRKLDRQMAYPKEFVDALTEAGYLSVLIPEEYGGSGLKLSAAAAILEEIQRAGCNGGGCHAQMYTMGTVLRHGNDAQKGKWLPKIASGEVRGGLALTEPDAGTDLQGIRMTARREGSDYVINGTKTWITNGAEGSCFALLVKTDPQAQPRHKGMSLFIAPKQKGFTVGRKLEKLGYKSIDTAELVFDNYRIPVDNLIGGVEGQGFYQATSGLELGRINVAARGVGIAEGA